MFRLGLVLFASVLVVQAIDQKCLDCICKIESGCKPLDCHNDGGSSSCGYYQLKQDYYKDCHEPGKKPGESTEAAFERCAKDKACSEKCVNAYMDRYAAKCQANPKCEVWSRVHNGGPSGCKSSTTIPYWNKIKACLG